MQQETTGLMVQLLNPEACVNSDKRHRDTKPKRNAGHESENTLPGMPRYPYGWETSGGHILYIQSPSGTSSMGTIDYKESRS